MKSRQNRYQICDAPLLDRSGQAAYRPSSEFTDDPVHGGVPVEDLLRDRSSGVRLNIATIAIELLAQSRSHELPPWLRVAYWAQARANDRGHAPAYTGQLRRELGIDSSREVSRAIRLAKRRKLIDPCSTAACLVLPGCAEAACPANHREAS